VRHDDNADKLMKTASSECGEDGLPQGARVSSCAGRQIDMLGAVSDDLSI